MTDNEKRAHDLAISTLPHVMNECDWKYYLYNDDGAGYINPDVIETYKDLYDVFLEHIKGTY